MNPEKPTVLLAASTGVAPINIDSKTINTALAIPKNKGYVLYLQCLTRKEHK